MSNNDYNPGWFIEKPVISLTEMYEKKKRKRNETKRKFLHLESVILYGIYVKQLTKVFSDVATVKMYVITQTLWTIRLTGRCGISMFR